MSEKAQFTDLSGHVWTIRLDAPLVRHIAEVTGIKLTDLKSDPFLQLSTDPILLVDVLWLLVEDQAKASGVSDVEFGRALGDKIDEATEAMQEAIVGFSHSSRRSLLRSLLAENATMQTEAMEAAMAGLKTDRTKIIQALANRSRAEMMRLLASTDSAATDTVTSATSSTDLTP
jgi:hypothetical protein